MVIYDSGNAFLRIPRRATHHFMRNGFVRPFALADIRFFIMRCVSKDIEFVHAQLAAADRFGSVS